MNIEKKRIEGWNTGTGFIGHITLDKLAIPETVKVTLLGERIIPVSFDIYGHPNFTEDQEMLYIFKEEELKRQNGGKYLSLEAEIVYEEMHFNIPRSKFDTTAGIKKSLLSLAELNEMLQNRKMFVKAYKGERLNEFIILSRFLLDKFGQIMAIEQNSNSKLIINGDVEKYEEFCKHNNEVYTLTSGGDAIPTVGAICNCCGKKLTIDDIKCNPCVSINGKLYHYSCWRKYRRLIEIDKFTRRMMDLVYNSSDYQFELLPNGYCNKECCTHIPWFLFHTIDGDIIMGWRKHVISIEWQDNYKHFDMKQLFSTEDVTKWEKRGKRGIHAWSMDKACEYLKRVLNTVNPDYSII